MLEGGVGSISLDDPIQPRAVRLSVGCYEIFGGDPDRALGLARDFSAPCELIYGNDPGWRGFLLSVYGSRLADRPMEIFQLSLDVPRLQAAVNALAPPYRMQALTADWLDQLDAELQPHGLQTYAGKNAFLAHGFGFGAVLDGILACAATTYTCSATRAEIAIATRPAHQRKGLAFAVAARILLQCVERGITPAWSAANPVSKRLALRLGFRPAGICEVLYLHPGPIG